MEDQNRWPEKKIDFFREINFIKLKEYQLIKEK